nr:MULTISPECIES: hypothetical protein [unclassified Erythrobacter]
MFYSVLKDLLGDRLPTSLADHDKSMDDCRILPRGHDTAYRRAFEPSQENEVSFYRQG